MKNSITYLMIFTTTILSFLPISCQKSDNVFIKTKEEDGLVFSVPGMGQYIPNVPVGPDGKLKIVSDVSDMPLVFHPKSSCKNSSIWKYMKVEKAEALIITFWATWSKPSKTELPYLEAIYRKYKDKGLRVLAINIDQENSLF
jgi:thiol-disulfide isomerase/thioredoxin